MRFFKLNSMKWFSFVNILKELQLTALYLLFWILRILFFGWYGYIFLAEKTVVNNDEEFEELRRHGVWDKDAGDMLDEIYMMSEKPYPLTYISRPHPIFVLDVFSVSNAEFFYRVDKSRNLHRKIKTFPN